MRRSTVSNTEMTNLQHLTLPFLLVGYTKQGQLENQSLDANPAAASLSSERRRVLNNRDTGSQHQLRARQSAGELDVHVSWIAAWRNDARQVSSSPY